MSDASPDVSQTDSKPESKAAINELAARLDTDIIVFNYEILPPVDFQFMGIVTRRKGRRKNVMLVLTTEGGSADSAFRMMRFLQARYEHITILVSGWCKSAGTLMCIGANALIVSDLGELGPLDVQIVKADEMDEQKSGLVAEAAFEKMQQEAYKFFMGFVKDLGASNYRVTLKTAFDMAAKMTIGVVQPIFDKLEPVTIGEDFRSNRLALAYAERLNSHSNNLIRNRELDALENLLSGYPSHGFVIDFKEASELFKKVDHISEEMFCILRELGMDAVLPRNSRNGQTPRVEFLNDEKKPNQEAQNPDESASSSTSEGANQKRARPRNGADDLPGNHAQRGSKKPKPSPGVTPSSD